MRYILTYAIYSALRNENITFHHLRWSTTCGTQNCLLVIHFAHTILTNRRLTTSGTTHHRSAELNQKSKYIARLKVLLNKNLTKWRSPSLSAKADRDVKLRITTTLLCGTHRWVPYCVIVFSFSFSTFNSIYDQRVSVPKLATCNLQFATCTINA